MRITFPRGARGPRPTCTRVGCRCASVGPGAGREHRRVTFCVNSITCTRCVHVQNICTTSCFVHAQCACACACATEHRVHITSCSHITSDAHAGGAGTVPKCTCTNAWKSASDFATPVRQPLVLPTPQRDSQRAGVRRRGRASCSTTARACGSGAGGRAAAGARERRGRRTECARATPAARR